MLNSIAIQSIQGLDVKRRRLSTVGEGELLGGLILVRESRRDEGRRGGDLLGAPGAEGMLRPRTTY